MPAAVKMADHPNILICEADQLVVELLIFHLQNKEYRIRIARDGREALDQIGQSMPDAIILAGMLPVIDSDEILRRIREGDISVGSCDVPVLMLSERTKDEDIVRALNLGANDYILKPFSPVEVAARLAKLVREHQVQQWAKSLHRRARAPVSIPSNLLLPDDRELDCLVRDLSEEGFMAHLSDHIEPGTWLGLSLPNYGIVRAQIRWCKGGRIGGLFDRHLQLRLDAYSQAA